MLFLTVPLGKPVISGWAVTGALAEILFSMPLMYDILASNIECKQQVIESYGITPEKIHVLPFIPPKYISTKHTQYRKNSVILGMKVI